MMGVLHSPSERPRRVPATFAAPDLTMFCRLDGLGLEVTGQLVEGARGAGVSDRRTG